jgi:hypothetical protein
MGKKTKEHNKKVAKRNARIAEEKKKFQKMYTQMLEQKLKEYEKIMETEKLENDLKVTVGGQEVGFSIVEPNVTENNPDTI